jgi:hypothetical protein
LALSLLLVVGQGTGWGIQLLLTVMVDLVVEAVELGTYLRLLFLEEQARLVKAIMEEQALLERLTSGDLTGEVVALDLSGRMLAALILVMVVLVNFFLVSALGV